MLNILIWSYHAIVTNFRQENTLEKKKENVFRLLTIHIYKPLHACSLKENYNWKNNQQYVLIYFWSTFLGWNCNKTGLEIYTL